ncbi:uncharacterized protein METZ01_LOCUS397301, partial [marine metagenome]
SSNSRTSGPWTSHPERNGPRTDSISVSV